MIENNNDKTPEPDWNTMLLFFGSPKTSAYFGKQFTRKLAALIWVLAPERFDGKSLAQVAREEKIRKQTLYKHAANARRVFCDKSTAS